MEGTVIKYLKAIYEFTKKFPDRTQVMIYCDGKEYGMLKVSEKREVWFDYTLITVLPPTSLRRIFEYLQDNEKILQPVPFFSKGENENEVIWSKELIVAETEVFGELRLEKHPDKYLQLVHNDGKGESILFRFFQNADGLKAFSEDANTFAAAIQEMVDVIEWK